MLKRFVSIILLVLYIFSSVPVTAQSYSETNLCYEGFSQYGENDTNIESLTLMSGTDTRVLTDENDKVLFSRAYGDSVLFKAELGKSNSNETVVSANVKFDGEFTTGKLFTAVYSDKKVNFISIHEDGTLRVADNTIIGGVSRGRYQLLTVSINWGKQLFSVYINQKCVANKLQLPDSSLKNSPTAFEFQLNYNGLKESTIYIDDIWAYEGNELPWNKKRPRQSVSTEIFEFTPTTELSQEIQIISDLEFNSATTGVSTAIVGGQIDRVTDSEGNGILHIIADDKVNSSSYFDMGLSDVEEYPKHVVDMRIKVNSLSGSSSFNILDSKNSTGTWRLGYSIKGTGAISLRSGVGTVGILNVGEWNRLSVVYSIYSGIADVYVNGSLTGTHTIPDNFFPNVFRFDAISDIGSNLNVEFDWIRMYSGSNLMGDEIFDVDIPQSGDDSQNSDSSYSIMDPVDSLAKALDDKYVFMTGNNTMYLNGSKTTIGDNESRIMNISGTLMIPLDILNSIDNDAWIYDSSVSEITFGEYKFRLNEKKYTKSGVEDELSSPVVTQNETVYFPLRSIFEKVYGKKVDWDNRGFAVVSDSGIEVREDYYYLDHHKTWSPADLIYRFMQFDNPSGADIITDVSEKHPNNAHPRVWWTTDAMKYILNKSDNDGEWKGAYNEAIASANGHLKRDFSSLYTASDQEKQNAVARDFQPVMESLATAYLLSGDEQYAEKAVEMMKGFCSWDSLGFKVSNLTTGHWAAAMGIGYDTFYNYMNRTTQGQADLKYIRESIKRLTFDEHIEMYKKEAGQHWIDINDNFAGVVGGGYMMLLLAVCDEEDLREECEYLLPNVLKTLYSAAELYYPNGGYFEGVPYSTYMLGNFVKGLDAMFECCGTDYGLGSVPGFTRAGDYFTYLQTSKGCFNFHDALPLYSNNPVREFIGYRYNDPVQAEMGRRHKLLAHAKYDLRSLYYYSKAVVDKGLENMDLSGEDLDRYFYSSESGAFRSTFEETDPTFVGFHGGWTNVAHDMLDLGEFVFESDGIVWASDYGGDDYSLPDYFRLHGYYLYRKRPEGENCLVINPQVDPKNYYGQKLKAFAQLIDLEMNKPKGAKAAFDLTDAYSRDVTKYIRGYYFGDDRSTLVVQDELSLKSSSEVYWFMQTPAEIEIVDNSKAILRKDGKTLQVEVVCSVPGYELKAMEASPLPSTPVVEGQNPNTGYSRLAVHYPDVTGDIYISVKLSPEGDYIYKPHKYTPIKDWTIPDGNVKKKPQFTSVNINGKLVESFMPGSRSYIVELPYGTTDVPVVSATSDMGTVTVSQAETLADSAVIKIQADGFKDIECKVTFNVSTDRPIYITNQLSTELPYVGTPNNLIRPVAASGYSIPQEENGPDKILDGNMETRYAQNGTGMWFEFDLGEVMDISGVAIAFYDGKLRQTKFELLYSEDGTNFKRVFDGMSTGKTNDYDTLAIPGKVRYIRLVGNGNTAGSAWNSITEFRAYK